MLLTIFFLIVVLYLGAGFLSARKVKESGDFYVSGHKAGPYIVMGTFAATWISAAGMLAYPGLSYTGGIGAIVVWGAFPGFVIAILLIAPKLYRSRSWTLIDYFERRWDDPRLRVLGIIFLYLGLIPYLLAQVMGGAVVMSSLLPLDYKTMVVIVCVLFVVITLIGGAWSVSVTDTMMLMIVFFVAFFTLPFALSFAGGWKAVTFDAYALTPERFGIGGSALSPGYYVAAVFIWMCGMFAAPHQCTRLLIAKDEKTAVKGMLLALILGFFAVYCLHMMCHSFWYVNSNIPAAKSATALPTLFTSINPVVGAIGIAGLFAAALSTTTSMLLVLSMGVGKDIYRGFINPNVSEKNFMLITRWAVVVIGALVFIMAWFQVSAIAKWAELGASVFACVFFPALLLGLNWRRITHTAVFWSMLLGGGVDIIYWMAWRFGGVKLLWGWQPVIWGIIVAFVVMIGISLVTTPTAKEIEEFEMVQSGAYKSIDHRVGEEANL